MRLNSRRIALLAYIFRVVNSKYCSGAEKELLQISLDRSLDLVSGTFIYRPNLKDSRLTSPNFSILGGFEFAVSMARAVKLVTTSKLLRCGYFLSLLKR